MHTARVFISSFTPGPRVTSARVLCFCFETWEMRMCRGGGGRGAMKWPVCVEGYFVRYAAAGAVAARYLTKMRRDQPRWVRMPRMIKYIMIRIQSREDHFPLPISAFLSSVYVRSVSILYDPSTRGRQRRKGV